MKWRNIAGIAKDVYWVGVRDWNRRLFDALIPLPKGTTYNAYLVIGSDKKALVDTVNPGFEKELEEKISKVISPSEIDYVIMNHAEPDHAGAIPHIMAINSKAKLVASSKGAKMAQTYFHVPIDRMKVVTEGETIDLGGKTLEFIEAPMLHWPETMFTYLRESKILFPCDFFGLHVAKGLYDDEAEALIDNAQRYFGEIMMPFRAMGLKALEKIRPLDIQMIAPSHGPVHRNPKIILEAYKKWASGETKEKAIVVYATMWKSTEKMILAMVDILSSEGVEVALHNLTVTDVGEIAKDLVDSRAIVLGVPTVLGGAHPLGVYATYLVKALKPPLKYGVVMTSYGWSGGAIKHVQDVLGPTNIEVVGTMEINGPPTEENVHQIVELGKALAKKIREGS